MNLLLFNYYIAETLKSNLEWEKVENCDVLNVRTEFLLQLQANRIFSGPKPNLLI